MTRRLLKRPWSQSVNLYILSDQGANVDGDIIRDICSKRRSSGYHSEGKGFAERNIRTIRELFRTLPLDFNVPQNQRDELLPGIIFALNTSISKVDMQFYP